jgi:hypothetical protein
LMDLLSQKTHHYNRKFYNKFSYKVSLRIKGSGCFRLYNTNEIRNLLSSETNNGRKYYLEQLIYNKEEVLNLLDFLETNNLENITKRVERDYIDFYMNDRDIYEKMSQQFLNILKHRFEPKPGVEISSDESTIFVSKLPHGKYEYKVYLRPHKMKGDKEAKKSYLDWIDTQGEKIKISAAVKKWFLETDWNWDRSY